MISPALLAVCLGLFSAVTVAAANFAVKRGGDVLTARMVLSIAMALTVVPAIPFVPAPPPHLWPNLLLAVVVHWSYQLGLIKALHRGELSRVFPVMRGAAPLLVAIAATVFLQEYLAQLGWAGLVLATIAVAIFAMPETKDISLGQKALDRSALIWAGVTALGICAYSIVDAKTIRLMPSPYTFIVYLFLLDWVGITTVTLWTRRGQVWTRVKPQLRAGLLGGVAGTLSYGAALYAFTLTDAALVTALRETSVVWAALMGAILLKEGFGPRRIFAASLLAVGLIMMQMFG